MNKDLIAPRVSSSSFTTATIHALDFTSFTTDPNQQWRSPTPRSPAIAQPNYNNSFNQDFQLFAASETQATPPIPTRAQAIPSIIPNRHRQLQSRHLSVNSRVPTSQSTQSPSLGHFNSFNKRSYSSPTLHLSQNKPQNLRQLAHLQQLPPVPPFDSVSRTVHSAPTVPQGTSHSITQHQSRPLTHPSGTMTTAFDSMYLPGGDLFASHDEFLDPQTNYQHHDFTINSPLIHDGTVSPSDLFNDDSMIMSAPPSTAFPNLSTPDSAYLESPATGLNTSPLEDGLLDSQLNFHDLDSMAPLFPQDDSFDQFASVMIPEPSVARSFSAVNSRPQSTASPMVRQKSSPGRPPSVPFGLGHSRKHSDAYGVNKAKARKSLPEISVDSEDDKETAKRKKNTAAARKSRMRKQEHAEASDAEIQRLRAMIYRMGGDPDERR